MFNKITTNVYHQLKSNFYLKSLSIKCDFSLYNSQFKMWHPEYFDVVRRTEYQKRKRDTRKLRFNTQDPLHFDYNMEPVTGGFERLLQHVKKDYNHQDGMAIYRIIYISYHMVKSGLMDSEFFELLESQITPTIANSSLLNVRQVYGMLYAYYSFNLGKQENIFFFENLMEIAPNSMHPHMVIELFLLSHKTKMIDSERLSLLITNFYKQNFINNWDTQIKSKQSLLTEFHKIFMEINYLDEDIWNLLITATVDKKFKIQNMDHYDMMLRGLLWYNSQPQSPKFQKINNEIEKFKDKIKNNENRFWRYNPDVNIIFKT